MSNNARNIFVHLSNRFLKTQFLKMEMMRLKIHRFLDFAMHCQNALVLDIECLFFHVIIQLLHSVLQPRRLISVNQLGSLALSSGCVQTVEALAGDQRWENKQVEILFFPNLSLLGHSLEKWLHSSTNSYIFYQTASLP